MIAGAFVLPEVIGPAAVSYVRFRTILPLLSRNWTSASGLERTLVFSGVFSDTNGTIPLPAIPSR